MNPFLFLHIIISTKRTKKLGAAGSVHGIFRSGSRRRAQGSLSPSLHADSISSSGLRQTPPLYVWLGLALSLALKKTPPRYSLGSAPSASESAQMAESGPSRAWCCRPPASPSFARCYFEHPRPWSEAQGPRRRRMRALRAHPLRGPPRPSGLLEGGAPPAPRHSEIAA